MIGLLLALMGLALGVGGLWLAVLGGSLYYLPAGAALGLAGFLLMQRRSAALWLYAGLVAVTLAWSLGEAGLDWWPLAARGDVLFLFGLLLLMPRVAQALDASSLDTRASRLALGLALGLFAATAAAAWFFDPHEIVGTLPQVAAPAAGSAAAAAVPPGEWHAYGRTAHGQRYSPLDQITPANVSLLQLAWTYRTGDTSGGNPDEPEEASLEVTPLKVGNRLFLCTPHQQVIALDATTGAQLWRYDPKVQSRLASLACRGLSFQPVVAAGVDTDDDCTAKLFMPTADGRLIALNPDKGTLCTGFGRGKGQIDLWANMRNAKPGAYYLAAPVVVTRNLVIVGGSAPGSASTARPSGVIRAFDVDNGALVWNWDPGNPDITAPVGPRETYSVDSPNSWSISSVDETLGMVYVPMGDRPPDPWEGNSSATVQRYSSAIVALDLATGHVRWSFQAIHHDLWGYGLPAQPSLVDLTIKGATVPALVQPTRQGDVFVLDRRTGTPLLPVTEVQVPQDAAQGKRTALTQPHSALSFDPNPLGGGDMWGVTLFDQLYCRIAFHRLRYEGRFTPPTLRGSLIYPGSLGVFDWGGVAVDPRRQVAFATPAYLAFVYSLVPRADRTAAVVQDAQRPSAPNDNFRGPFAAELDAFVSPLGIPCQAPPWGYVAGIDLTTGKVAWMRKNGTVRGLAPVPLSFKMGVPHLGGPIVTAGGVAFLSGTMDSYLRAYDMTNGNELWESRLPARSQATPMTYTGADGRQFLLVMVGGHGSGTRVGDYVLAYALPES